MVFWRDVDEAMLRAAITSSKTKGEAVASLGFSVAASNFAMFDMLAKKHGIDTSSSFHCDLPGRSPSKSTGKFVGRLLTEICVKESTYVSTVALKRRLLKEGWLERKCYVCGLTHWAGDLAPIGALRLDHINGVRTDNTLENLRLICGICDASTDTFCGRNRRVTFRKLRPENPCVRCKKRPRLDGWRHCEGCIAYLKGRRVKVRKIRPPRPPRPQRPCPYCGGKFTPRHTVQKHCSRPCADMVSRIAKRPGKDALLELLRTHSWSALGRMYGVSDNAIRKWVRACGVDPSSLNPPRY